MVANFVEKYVLGSKRSIEEITKSKSSVARRMLAWLNNLLSKLERTHVKSTVEMIRDEYAEAMSSAAEKAPTNVGKENVTSNAKATATQTEEADLDSTERVKAEDIATSLMEKHKRGLITDEEFDLLYESAERQIKGRERKAHNLDVKFASGEITEEEYAREAAKIPLPDDDVEIDLEKAKKNAEGYNKPKPKEPWMRYSISVNAKEELHKALYDTSYQGEVKLRDETPSIMTSQKGVKNLPMSMNASHIRENVFSEEEAQQLGLKVNEHIHYHGLGEEFFLQVIDGLDNVAEAYRGTSNASDSSRRENYFLLISKFKDKDGNTINVPVYINKRARSNNVFIDVNKISTAFGRNELRDYINKQIRDNNLTKIKNRSTQASESNALIARDYGMNASDDTTISHSVSSVNSENEDVTQMQQFNRWFGDWQNHPRTASKVVN